MAIAREGSAPTSEQIAMASGEVMFRDSVASRRLVGRPSNLHRIQSTRGRWRKEAETAETERRTDTRIEWSHAFHARDADFHASEERVIKPV